jgi:hypothetical protein
LFVAAAAAGCDAKSFVEAIAEEEYESGALDGIDCEAILDAQTDLGLHINFFLRLDSDEAYARLTDPEVARAFRMDPVRLRHDLDVLSALPDCPTNEAIVLPLSQSLPELREMADVLEANLASGRPFSDGSGGGEKLLGMAQQAAIVSIVTVEDAIEQAGCY